MVFLRCSTCFYLDFSFWNSCFWYGSRRASGSWSYVNYNMSSML